MPSFFLSPINCVNSFYAILSCHIMPCHHFSSPINWKWTHSLLHLKIICPFLNKLRKKNKNTHPTSTTFDNESTHWSICVGEAPWLLNFSLVRAISEINASRKHWSLSHLEIFDECWWSQDQNREELDQWLLCKC